MKRESVLKKDKVDETIDPGKVENPKTDAHFSKVKKAAKALDKHLKKTNKNDKAKKGKASKKSPDRRNSKSSMKIEIPEKEHLDVEVGRKAQVSPSLP